MVCLGVDGDKVAWCHTLSWMDAPTLDVAVKDYFLHNPSLRLTSFVSWLRDHLDLWKRKEFKDFKYLGWNMSHSGSTLFWLVALAGSVATLLCSFWIGGWPSDIRHEREAILAAERERVELVQLTNAAQRRAPGTYFFAAGSDIFRVEVASDGTLTAQELPCYTYQGFSGTQYWNEGETQSGTWTVNDPHAHLDIVLCSRAFGFTDYRILNNQVYKANSYGDDKPLSNCISEAEYNGRIMSAKSKFNATSWVKDTTSSWIYDDDWGLPHKRYYDFHDWIVFNTDGTFQTGGPMHYNPYDRAEIRVGGTWELVAMKPTSREPYDIASGSTLATCAACAKCGHPRSHLLSKLLHSIHLRIPPNTDLLRQRDAHRGGLFGIGAHEVLEPLAGERVVAREVGVCVTLHGHGVVPEERTGENIFAKRACTDHRRRK